MKKKHGAAWWILVGWWWYIGIAWWLYPIIHLVRRKAEAAPADNGSGYDPRKLEETMRAVVDAVERSGGSALQVDVKKSLPGWMGLYFDDAVHELYENGRVKMSKDGSRVRLELAV